MADRRCRSAEFTIAPHTQVGHLPAQALRLASVAFAGYAGVTLPSEGKINWYLARPRMRRDLSMGALTADGQLVSSVYITLEQLRLGGQLAPVALVDTVMTDPEYRRHGLARRVLAAALEAARRAGADAALLFTVPGSMPYRFYQTLGFMPVEHIRVLARRGASLARRGASLARQGASLAHRGIGPEAGDVRSASTSDAARLLTFWNHVYGAHEGYVPLDETLWRWRRAERPAVLPSETLFCEIDEAVVAAVNLCAAPVIGERSRSLVVTDLAWEPGGPGLERTRALLQCLPDDAEARILVPESDKALGRLISGDGWYEIGREAAMLAPLSREGERRLVSLQTPWYALPESVIGV